MMVTVDQIKRGVANYYEAEFCQKATGVGKFTAYFMLPSIPATVGKYIDKAKDLDVLGDIILSDGSVNIDEAKSRATLAMDKVGSLELMGYRLNRDDVEMIYRHIMEVQ